MQNVQRIVLVDFGAQYTQLIARRVREAKVFCEVVSYLTPLSEILEKKPVGIILSGGPASVLDADAPHIDPAIYEQGIPVLGICYGMQLTAYTLGGTVERAAQREYGRVPVDFDVNSPLFAGMKRKNCCNASSPPAEAPMPTTNMSSRCASAPHRAPVSACASGWTAEAAAESAAAESPAVARMASCTSLSAIGSGCAAAELAALSGFVCP